MYDLSKHPYFEEFLDPKTGVKSYILKERVADLQSCLYFTEMGGITADEKYMWFYCYDYPKKGNTIGVVSLDPDNPFIRRFNNAGTTPGMGGITNMHTLDGNYAFFPVGPQLFKIDVDGNITKVFEVDKELIQSRRFDRFATHTTVDASGEFILMDMFIGGKCYIATGNLKTGEMKVIHKFVRQYNHAQFSPTDPNLFLLDEEWETDPVSGERFSIDKRIWLMDIHGTKFEPIDPDKWFFHDGSVYCHDFWSKDGYICWPDLDNCVFEYNPYTKEKSLAWNRAICHAHTLHRKYWVGDADPYSWSYEPCKVWFFDRENQKEIEIFSALPRHKYPSGYYHLDPHPAFSPKGTYVVSMTTVKGNIDVAITPTAPLIERCREFGEKVK